MSLIVSLLFEIVRLNIECESNRWRNKPSACFVTTETYKEQGLGVLLLKHMYIWDQGEDKLMRRRVRGFCS